MNITVGEMNELRDGAGKGLLDRQQERRGTDIFALGRSHVTRTGPTYGPDTVRPHQDLVIASADHEALFGSHRQEVTVVFCDLRGFTAFAETAQPEEVMAVLADYHAALGELVLAYEGTLERFLGDGLVVLFNDPLPCPDHPQRAVRMALDMQARVGELTELWRRSGHQLGFGIGIAQGEATLGRIGFDRRLDYAAIGRIPNLAARLCAKAKGGQVLVSEQVYRSTAAEGLACRAGDLMLKGFQAPVRAYEVTGWRGALR